MRPKPFLAVTLALMGIWHSVAAVEWPPVAPCRIAADGKPRVVVVTGTSPSQETRLAAQELADMLSAMSGGGVTVTTGAALDGIAVGTPSDFPTVETSAGFAPDDPLRREEYVLRSHPGGVLVIGATPQAARHAVWDLLYRLGYRHYFPPPEWEIVPSLPEITVTIDARERPDYVVRRIWPGFGTWKENEAAWARWRVHNRADSSFVLNTGHAYDQIRKRNARTIADHPEYLGFLKRKNKRASTKFCISNADLRKMVVADALAQRDLKPGLDSLSLDPSDGDDWCECEACLAMPSITDRALLLANEAALGLAASGTPCLVGMYAYNRHSPPPLETRVHPQVVISIATAFLQGGFTVDRLLDGWRAQGARMIGIREYYSVNTWDRDLPGAARGGDLAYLARTIPAFHAQNARFMSAEASDNWGPNGLGYYFATRLLWSTQEASRQQPLVDEFFATCFGPAQEPMRGFYALLDSAAKPLLSEDLVARMYRHIDAALRAADAPASRARIHHLLLYTRYVELYRGYAEAQGADRQAAFEALIRHAYRIRGTHMVHSQALWKDLPTRDRSVRVPADAEYRLPEAVPAEPALAAAPGPGARFNPWKTSEPFTAAELANLLSQGLATNAVLELDFKPVSFSADLVKPVGVDLATARPPAPAKWKGRGKHRIRTWVDQAPDTIRLQVRGGIIYQNKGDVTLALYAGGDTEGEPVARAQVPPDREHHLVELKTDRTGLHTLLVKDGWAGMQMEWEPARPMTFMLDTNKRWDEGAAEFVFYVPKGTPVIGGYAGGVKGVVRDPEGGEAFSWTGDRRHFSIPVPRGMDGRTWSFEADVNKEHLWLMTVPPYMARNPGELLLPREVVEADRAAGK